MAPGGFPRRRFLLNHRNFDKLYKIRPLIDSLSENFLKSYNPSEHQSIDESMVKFEGCSSLKQYMPKKPIKRGYKLWVRANENGYTILEFAVYTGKKEVVEKDLGPKIARELTKKIEGNNQKVFFDNYFTSLPLLSEFQGVGIQACGTIKADRVGFPKNDLAPDSWLEWGDFDWLSTLPGITAIKWRDRRCIHFAPNFHNPNQITSANRKEKDGSKTNLTCPIVVSDYTKHMGYVDKADMLEKCYEISRKSKKWWHHMAFHLIDLAVVNSFILFKTTAEGKPLSLKDFRFPLATSLMLSGSENARTPPSSRKEKDNHYKKSITIEKRTAGALHLPVRSTKRRCANCSSKAVPHRSCWSCQSCDVGLCLSYAKNCFLDYHKL